MEENNEVTKNRGKSQISIKQTCTVYDLERTWVISDYLHDRVRSLASGREKCDVHAAAQVVFSYAAKSERARAGEKQGKREAEYRVTMVVRYLVALTQICTAPPAVRPVQ